MAKKLYEFKKIAKQFATLLADEGIEVESILMYGSQARGNATEDSDIDLVVISDDLGKFEPLQRLEFLSRIAWKCDVPLEIVGYTKDEIKGKEGVSIFWDEIRSTSRTIYRAA